MLLLVLLAARPGSFTQICFEHAPGAYNKCNANPFDPKACAGWMTIVTGESPSLQDYCISSDDAKKDQPWEALLDDHHYVKYEQSGIDVYSRTHVCHNDSDVYYWCEGGLVYKSTCNDLRHYEVPRNYVCPLLAYSSTPVWIVGVSVPLFLLLVFTFWFWV